MCDFCYNNQEIPNRPAYVLELNEKFSQYDYDMHLKVLGEPKIYIYGKSMNIEASKMRVEIAIKYCPMCGRFLEKKDTTIDDLVLKKLFKKL